MADWSAAIILRDQFSAALGKLQNEAKAGATALVDMGSQGARAADLLAGGLTKVAGLAVGGYAAMQVGAAVIELTRLGATAETVGGIYDNLTASYRVNGAELLAGLQAASRGTMDTVSMMQVANRALLAGGAELANELPRLFEIARGAALASGDDINYVYETLIKGIIRGSPLLIDNAGIYIKVGQAVDKYAASLGVSTDELDGHGKMMATLNAVLAEGGAFMERTGTDAETAADKVQSLTASWQNLRGQAGEVLLRIGVVTVIDTLGQNLNNVAEALDLNAQFKDLKTKLELGGQVEEANRLAAAWRTINNEYAINKRVIGNNRAADLAAEQQRALLAETEQYVGAVDDGERAYLHLMAATQAQAGAQAQATNQLADYTAALDELRAKVSTAGDLAKLTFNMEGAQAPQMPKVSGPLLSIDVDAIREYLGAVYELGGADAAAANETRAHANALAQAQTAYIMAQVAATDQRQALVNLATATLGAGSGVLDLVDKFDQLPPAVQEAALQCGLLEAAVADLRAEAAAPITIDVRVDALQNAQGDVDRMALQLLNTGWSPERVRQWRDQTQADLESHWLKIGETDQFGLDLEMETLTSGYQDQVEAEVDRNRQIEQARDKHVAEMKRKAEELRSSAESALMRGAQPSELDWLQTKTGAYQDAPLEAARRLDAIAERGFAELKAHPDWAAMLKIPPEILAGSNDQLRAWAMQTSQAVTDLTRPDLIDWDAFTREFQQQEADKAAKENTINLAVSKLSAAGVLGGDTAKITAAVNDMFGETDPGGALTNKMIGTGTKLMTGLKTELDAGRPIILTAATQLGADLAKNTVDAAEKGFGQLRKRLATAIAPDVWNWIKAQQGAQPLD